MLVVRREGNPMPQRLHLVLSARHQHPPLHLLANVEPEQFLARHVRAVFLPPRPAAALPTCDGARRSPRLPRSPGAPRRCSRSIRPYRFLPDPLCARWGPSRRCVGRALLPRPQASTSWRERRRILRARTWHAVRLPFAFSKRTREERDSRLPSRGRVYAGPDR